MSAITDLVTLHRDDLNRLLDEAMARGAAQAQAVQSVQYLDNAGAAALFYGRSDRLEAWRALRLRYAEIDAISLGTGRFRRWRIADIEKLMATLPRFAERTRKARQAQSSAQGGEAM